MALRLSCFRGTWDLPSPGIKPLSSALAGGFLTTGPPGKSTDDAFSIKFCSETHVWGKSQNNVSLSRVGATDTARTRRSLLGAGNGLYLELGGGYLGV